MATKIFLMFILLALYGICIPLFKAMKPPKTAFLAYVLWLLLLGIIWMFLVFGTNAIC